MFLMCNIIFYIVARDPIDNHKTCSVKKYTLPFTSLPTGTEKKLTLTYFCYCERTHYPQNFRLDTSKNRQIHVCNTSSI